MENLKTIGRENAIKLGETNWWIGKTAREIVGFQLFVAELACPFDVFHKAVEESLGRPVFTHEFGLNVQGLQSEFLGTKAPPSFKEVVDLLPEDKRIILTVN